MHRELLMLAVTLTTLLGSASTQQLLPPQSPTYHDVSSVALKQIPPVLPETKGRRRENIVHRLPYVETKGVQKDPVVQRSATRKLPIVAGSFEGLGQGMAYDPNVAPPDTTGAVGRDYFIEWVNDAFVILKKDTGEKIYGPTVGNTFWHKFAPPDNPAHACEDTNDGDPIVVYDRFANRWVVSQFSHSDGRPYLQCIAVSMSSDPLGTYARYAYQFPNFNDYGKMGVWPDGYYASFNMFASPEPNSEGKGAEACAFDRASMLAGKDAKMVCFAITQSGLLPADVDGSLEPPARSPNYFLSLASGRLNYWRFHVDWSSPQHSTMAGPDDIGGVLSFVGACTPDTCEIVPQRSSKALLDTLGDRLMYRLAYRNFGDHQALVVNHAVRVPGAENGNLGVTSFRWYEIRVSSHGLNVQQSGTFRPNGISRWMGSMAMDKVGDIGIGYSTSSASDYPSVYFTGRLSNDSDPLSLGQEYQIRSGEGSQTSDRWGDYSTMSVDPTDDCTFWFVSQYLKKEDANKWHTNISHLRFGVCQ